MQGESLFKGLNKAVHKTVVKTGLPYIMMSEEKQIGETFGKRLSNAMETVYKMGYENVIAIGNDTPQLKANHLLKAAKELTHTKAVLGPTFDGGFYLLGLHKSAFNVQSFHNFKWQTEALTSQLVNHFKAQSIFTTLLTTFFDIDDAFGLKAVAKFTQSVARNILLLISQLLRMPSKAFCNKISTTTTIYKHVFFNKGSPLLVT